MTRREDASRMTRGDRFGRLVVLFRERDRVLREIAELIGEALEDGERLTVEDVRYELAGMRYGSGSAAAASAGVLLQRRELGISDDQGEA